MKKRKLGFFLTIIIIIIGLAILLVYFINRRITPTIMDYSKTEIKRMASIILNKSASDDVLSDINIDELFIVSQSSNEVLSVTLDSALVNKITNRISDKCEENLRKIENGKFEDIQKDFNITEDYFYVPVGVAFHNTVLSEAGPKIPIRLKLIGNVTSNISTEVKDYGINNSLITISVNVKVELMVLLPFSSDFVSITNSVPIAIKLIQGKVPLFYGGNLLN